MNSLNDIYADCHTYEDFEEARKRYNLWICCEIAPEVAMEHIRREEEGRECLR